MRPNIKALLQHHHLHQSITQFIHQLQQKHPINNNGPISKKQQPHSEFIQPNIHHRTLKRFKTPLPENVPHEFLQTMLRESKYYQPLIDMGVIDDYCVFCNSEIIYEGFVDESEHWFCLYNIRPVFPGHCLVIPKDHLTGFVAISPEQANDFVGLTQLVVKALKSLYQTDSVEYLIQEGELAGQSIAHLHLHIMPRVLNDIPSQPQGDQEWMDYFTKMEHTARILGKEERMKLARKIREEMRRLKMD